MFGDTYGVKRLQPGEILMVERAESTFSRDCLTLRGNGGSLVVDLETGLGLVHFAEHWHENQRGYAVALWPLAHHPMLQRPEIRL